MKTFNDLTEQERKKFTELFYDHTDIDFDDTETALPWGLPWLWCGDKKIEDVSVENLVNLHIADIKKELYELEDKEIENLDLEDQFDILFKGE